MQELVISILLTVVIIMAAALLIFVGSRKDGMTKKQRVMMIRILISAGILLALQFVSAEMLDTADSYLFPSAGRWIRFACYLINYFIIGYDILRKAAKGIRNRQVFDESFLMAVATIGAMALAIYENGDYLEAIAVMLFYQIGEWFQGYAVGKSRRNISNLMDIRPDYANVERNGKLEQVDPDEVGIGSVIVVQPGEKVPIDGNVVEGASSLNTSALTGESLPREAKVGDEVISGCISMTGVLKIQTTKEFGESTVSKILDLVENASSRKSKSEDFISKFAKVYTPAVCYSALALALLPPVVRMLFMGLSADWGVWIYRALTFLVISCPCALVISIPLSFFAGIGGASKEGVLVKGSNYLEILSQTRYVVFDKTGTMTKGVFEVNGIHHSTIDNEKLLEYAALAESASSHPISKSLQRAYGKEINRSRVSDIHEIGGNGVTAKVDGKPLLEIIGTPALTAEQWAEIQSKVTKGGANIINLRGRSSFQSPAYVSIEMIAAAMGGKPFRWPAGTYVHSHGFDHIMMAMETEITKDGVHYKELKGTPEEEAKLKESYAHLCKLRDEVIGMGVLPEIKDWKSINPNID